MSKAEFAVKILTTIIILTPCCPILAQKKNLRLVNRKVETVKRWPSNERRYALLIGVNNYYDEQITSLTGSINDMVNLEEALVNYCGFDSNQVIRLTDDKNELSSKPTYRNILTHLSKILKAVPKDGLLLIAFSGHGIERNGRAFLLPSDASVNSDILLLEKTALEVAAIKEWIDHEKPTGLAQVVVLLDACRNDPTSAKDLSRNSLTKAYDFNLKNSKVQAFATIYATSRGERAYENKPKRKGYFISEIVAGLSGEAANERGEVTLEQLIKHVESKVPRQVIKDLGVTQKPFMELQGYKASELVIAYTPAARKTKIGAVGRPIDVRPSPEPLALRRVISLPLGVRPEASTEFNFMTATVDSKGKVIKYPGDQTQQYTEDLGEGVRLEMVPVSGNGAIRDFWMGKYEVTQEQWYRVMSTDPSGFKGSRLPVETVSWSDAKNFCQTLNRKLGLSDESGYRLPEEKEWEYAARAGTSTNFAFGDKVSSEIVNCDCSIMEPGSVSRNATVKVGVLELANAWGFFDMHGNVWEWCEDSDETGMKRVIRGGGWNDFAENCSSGNRQMLPLISSSNKDIRQSIGFRVIRYVP